MENLTREQIAEELGEISQELLHLGKRVQRLSKQPTPEQTAFLEQVVEVNDDIYITTRTVNALRGHFKRADVTYWDVISMTEREVLSIKHLGYKSFKCLREQLAEYGLTFKGPRW